MAKVSLLVQCCLNKKTTRMLLHTMPWSRQFKKPTKSILSPNIVAYILHPFFTSQSSLLFLPTVYTELFYWLDAFFLSFIQGQGHSSYPKEKQENLPLFGLAWSCMRATNFLRQKTMECSNNSAPIFYLALVTIWANRQFLSGTKCVKRRRMQYHAKNITQNKMNC